MFIHVLSPNAHYVLPGLPRAAWSLCAGTCIPEEHKGTVCVTQNHYSRYKCDSSPDVLLWTRRGLLLPCLSSLALLALLVIFCMSQ